ncbi:MAG: DinB family protein [Anaerolineales bacterium]
MTAIIDNKMLWHQYGAAIDDLEYVLRDCPDELWEEMLWDDHADQWVARGFSKFWYLGYHVLFWLDLYLFGAEEGFAPPAPFDLVEMHANESLPRIYSREELLHYLAACREKCKDIVLGMTEEEARRMCKFPWGELPYGELQLYNLRHVAEHGSQLRMFLGQRANKQAKNITRVE